jgi:cobalamin biosynthesis Mg chelatase CobN
MSVDDIMTETVRDMKKDMTEIMAKMMGFNNHWGRWEVDHCNGRRSVISDVIEDKTRAVVTDWINENLTADLTKKILDKQRAELVKDFTEGVHRGARSQLYRLTEELGQNIADEIAAELNKELRGKNGL